MEDLQNINWIDGVIVGMLLLSSAWGLARGLVRGVFGILALAASFVAAQKYGGALGRAAAVLLGESVVTVVLGYALAFVLGMLVFGALTYLARKTMAGADLGMLDKFGGLVFGAARGALLGGLFILLLAAFPLQKAEAWRESFMVPFLGGALNAAAGIETFRDYRQHLQFDSRNRPRWVIAAAPKPRQKPREAKTEEPPETEKGRDDLLDELNDEATRQSLHNNEDARRNAMAFKNKIREESVLQKFGGVLDALARKISCEGADCDKEK